jgi:SAM-dependent methyltransferase
MENQFYSDKLKSLKEIFQEKDLHLEKNNLMVGKRIYPIVDDVIVLLDPKQYPQSLKNRLKMGVSDSRITPDSFSEDIQFTFGKQWEKFSRILPEYQREFEEYFDIVDLDELVDKRVCDLGCGTGRWSYFLKGRCRELVLLDFSEAIFVARANLKDVKNALFFMGDLTRLPFKEDFADFLFCLGVLHHLPTDALKEVRQLKKYSKKILIYLYYSLDNRPLYFKGILALVTSVRILLSKVRNPAFRNLFTWFGLFTLYIPCICLGSLFKPFGLSKYVPLYSEHYWNSIEEIRHHVYDRFFTSIEQRFSRKEIMKLEDTFSKVIVSDQPGYWHFLCVNENKPIK